MVSDGSSYERIILFGGIQNQVQNEKVQSRITNKTYMVQVKQRDEGVQFVGGASKHQRKRTTKM